MNGSCKIFSRLALFSIALVLTFTGLGRTAFADDASQARAVRLTYLQGSVTVATGEAEKIPAQLNMPLLAGVQLATADDGQVEIEFEDGSVVRLTPNSSLKLDRLTVQQGHFDTRITLERGLAFAELRAAPKYKYAISAGCDVLSPTENLTVRIDFDQPPATFSVLEGSAHLAGCAESAAGFQTDVFAGESVKADASNPNRYFLSQTLVQDSWNQWNEDLDQKEAAQSSNSTDVRNNYAGSQGYGWSDLDANGTWYDVQGTGPVWQPSLAVDDMGFDPFGYGSWVSYPGSGYVWASGYPWGWTPYRCGNWSFFGGFGWGWSPVGCGGVGFVIGSHGHPVNVAKGPPSYLAMRPPQPGHGPERPLIPVHTFVPQHRDGKVDYVQREINGRTVTAVQPQISVFGAGRVTAGGSALRRDFPVDRVTHTPVMGNPSARSTVSAGTIVSQARTRPGLPVNAASPAISPVYRGQSHPERVEQGARPVQQIGIYRGAAPGTQPPSPVRPGYAPAPSTIQPRMAMPPPAQVHPNYTPPPAVVQPRMSAPPTAAPATRAAPAPAAQAGRGR